MEENLVKKVYIIYNYDKDIAIELYNKSVDYFTEKGIEAVENIEDADFGVVIGGDGTLLRSFKKFILKKNMLIIAINAGKLGFLTEIKKERMIDEYNNFLSGDFKCEKRHILEVLMGEKIYYSLNEVVIRDISKLIKVDFKIDNEEMCTYKGDGVIVATPSGSTAYSLSAGGPILKADMKSIVVTPIAPHNLNTRPIVLGGENVITLTLTDKEKEGQIIIDGQVTKEIKSEDIVTINYSKYTLNLVVPKDRNYYSVLREKLKWGDNLC